MFWWHIPGASLDLRGHDSGAMWVARVTVAPSQGGAARFLDGVLGRRIDPPWRSRALVSDTTAPSQDEGIFGHVRPELHGGQLRSHSAFLLSGRYFLFII